MIYIIKILVDHLYLKLKIHVQSVLLDKLYKIVLEIKDIF